MSRSLQRVFRGVVLSVVLLLVACTAVRPTKGDITVYVAAPLSGWQADGGQTVVGGVRLAAEQINERGGVLGYRIKVVALDDEADSDVAVQVANEVAGAVQSGEQVLAVIGHYNSGQAAAALPIYSKLPLIVITPTASEPGLTQQGYGNFFRINATDAAQGPAVATFLVNVVKAQRIVLVYANNEYGAGLEEQVEKALQAMGRPPVGVFAIEEAADTHLPVIPQIQAASPDAIFLAGYETEGYVLLPELREAGVEATFMASDGCFLYEFIDGSGKWAEGVYVSGITPDPKVVADEAWWDAYRKVETRNPGTYSIAGYSAMTVLAEAVKKANSLDRDAIERTLHSESFSSLVGTVRYDAKGDMQEQRIYIFQVRDGDFVQVQPAP